MSWPTPHEFQRRLLEGDVNHGFSRHRALKNLLRAGFIPADALNAEAIEPARHLGPDKNLGSIAVGKLAGLILRRANSLDDVGNT